MVQRRKPGERPAPPAGAEKPPEQPAESFPADRDESVPKGELTASPSNALAVPGDSSHKVFTNLTMQTPTDAARFMRALAKPDVDNGKAINTMFPIRHFLIHWIELIDRETGEITPAPRTILFSPEGKTMGFVSIGIYDSMRWLYRMFGPGPYNPAIPAILRQDDKGEGRRIYRLDLDDSSPMPELRWRNDVNR